METIIAETTVWRASNFLMSIFFAMAAFVQLNDPDSWLWIALYLIPSILSFAIVANPACQVSAIWNTVTCSQIAFCVFMACYVFYEYISEESHLKSSFNPLHHEAGREFFGLLIVIIWLTISRSRQCPCFKKPQDEESLPEGTSTSNLMIWTIIFSVFPLVLWALCYLDELKPFIGICKGMFKD